MSLLHCFVVIREMEIGGATFSSLYNLNPNVTIIAWGLDSYTTCHFHKYGWHNNTLQTSSRAMSHNTSSMNGLMLYGRWHCWLTRRSRPWWSHPMVYSCGCVVVSKPNCFMTFVAMSFFFLPLLTMNYSGKPFTHISEWKRCSNSSGSSSSSFWIFVVEMMAMGSVEIICILCHSPCLFLTQSRNMHLILRPLARPLVIAWPNTRFFCGWSSYRTHTTFLCASLDL